MIDLNADIILDTESDTDTLSVSVLNALNTLLMLSLTDINASVIDLGAVNILETVSDMEYDFMCINRAPGRVEWWIGGNQLYQRQNLNRKCILQTMCVL